MKKLHDVTGFYAYWIYVATKSIHFGNGKYDITKDRLPTKAKFLNSWNSERKDRDGYVFMRVQERIPAVKEAYIRCFAAYYLKNPAFHVSDILADDFQTYKANELELKDLLATVKRDYLTAILRCKERDIQYQTMFYGTGQHLPMIFRLYDQKKISANSLIAFDIIFGISNFKTRGFHGLTIVEEDRIKTYRKIFDKYSPIVYNYFKHIEWKEKIQDYHHYIMKYGR